MAVRAWNLVKLCNTPWLPTEVNNIKNKSVRYAAINMKTKNIKLCFNGFLYYLTVFVVVEKVKC